MIGGTTGPITAGLSPAEGWSACGERTDPGQKEPIAAMTKRQEAATAAVALRGRIRRTGTANARGRPGWPRRLTAAMPSSRRSGSTVSAPSVSAPSVSASTFSGSTFSASTLSGPTASGARIAFWIEAESSPQKSSARAGGGVACAASGDGAPSWSGGKSSSSAEPGGPSDALGPNGTSSSRGPNQSRGNWTTFDSDAIASSLAA